MRIRQHQASSYGVARAFTASNVAAAANNAIFSQRIAYHIRNFKIQRRTANKNHELNVPNVSRRSHSRQRPQRIGHEHSFLGLPPDMANAIQRILNHPVKEKAL